MDRNLNRRIETLVRVDDVDHKATLNQILSQIFSGEFEGWTLNESDVWIHEIFDTMGHRLPNFQEEQIREMMK
jgi:polyphosphate kinase